MFFASLLAAYLIGSIPFGFMLGKIFGVGNIRKIGFFGIGSINMLRTGKRSLAAATLLLDAGKGYVAIIAGHAFWQIAFHGAFSENSASDIAVADMINGIAFLVCGLAALLGHIFPVWLKFKGGKGVATAIGTLFLINYTLPGIVIILWLITFLIFRISSLSSLVAFTITTIAMFVVTLYHYYYIRELGQVTFVCGYFFAVTFILFVTHRNNIISMLAGREPKWGKRNEPS